MDFRLPLIPALFKSQLYSAGFARYIIMLFAMTDVSLLFNMTDMGREEWFGSVLCCWGPGFSDADRRYSLSCFWFLTLLLLWNKDANSRQGVKEECGEEDLNQTVLTLEWQPGCKALSIARCPVLRRASLWPSPLALGHWALLWPGLVYHPTYLRCLLAFRWPHAGKPTSWILTWITDVSERKDPTAPEIHPGWHGAHSPLAHVPQCDSLPMTTMTSTECFIETCIYVRDHKLVAPVLDLVFCLPDICFFNYKLVKNSEIFTLLWIFSFPWKLWRS